MKPSIVWAESTKNRPWISELKWRRLDEWKLEGIILDKKHKDHYKSKPLILKPQGPRVNVAQLFWLNLSKNNDWSNIWERSGLTLIEINGYSRK